MSNRILKDKVRDARNLELQCAMPRGMAKSDWDKQPCGCIKTELRSAGKVVIRCKQHLGLATKKGNRIVCYFDDNGIVRRDMVEVPVPASSRVTFKKKQSFVYFARLGDLIKVGHSTNPAQRASSLSAELIGFVPGTPEREAALHSSLRKFRVRNEWYRADAELLAVVERMLAPK